MHGSHDAPMITTHCGRWILQRKISWYFGNVHKNHWVTFMAYSTFFLNLFYGSRNAPPVTRYCSQWEYCEFVLLVSWECANVCQNHWVSIMSCATLSQLLLPLLLTEIIWQSLPFYEPEFADTWSADCRQLLWSTVFCLHLV